MFDSFNPDLEIENNSFDLLIQDEPDLFYRSIDHEFSQINKPSTIGIKINTSDAKLVLENFICGNESLLSEGLTLPKNESKMLEKEIKANQNISIKSTNQIEVHINKSDYCIDSDDDKEIQHYRDVYHEIYKDRCSLEVEPTYMNRKEMISSKEPRENIVGSLNFQNLKSELMNSELSDRYKSHELTINSQTRNDISYKNVFRAPKKYYLALFKENSKFFKVHTRSERKKIAHSELGDFVQTYFINKDCNKILNGLTKEDLINLVGRIVIPEYMTKEGSTYIFRKECGILHDCIYRYSLINSSKLYHTKYVGKIISFFLMSNEFSEMVQTDDKLRRFPQKHLEIAQEITASFQNCNMKFSN